MIAFAGRSRSAEASWLWALPLQGRIRRHDSPALAYQQRTTQRWVNISRLTGAAADAAQCAPPGGNSAAANDAGNANQPDCADKGVQLAGQSRVIHMLWNGFLFVGVEPGEKPWPRWVMGWAAARCCTWLACAWTPWVPWVHAAGSGSAAAASWGRNEDPAIRATNRLSAATIAMANCHRRVLPAPRRPTVVALYKTRLGLRPLRAVKTIKVRCVLPQMVCLLAYVLPRRTWPLAHLQSLRQRGGNSAPTELAFGAGSRACGTDNAPIDIPRPTPAVTAARLALTALAAPVMATALGTLAPLANPDLREVVSHRRCKWSSDVGSLEDQFEEGAYVRVEEVIAC